MRKNHCCRYDKTIRIMSCRQELKWCHTTWALEIFLECRPPKDTFSNVFRLQLVFFPSPFHQLRAPPPHSRISYHEILVGECSQVAGSGSSPLLKAPSQPIHAVGLFKTLSIIGNAIGDVISSLVEIVAPWHRAAWQCSCVIPATSINCCVLSEHRENGVDARMYCCPPDMESL